MQSEIILDWKMITCLMYLDFNYISPEKSGDKIKRGEQFMETITLANGEIITARFVRVYNAFEGGQRYVFWTPKGEYRCIKDENGNYIEYRP